MPPRNSVDGALTLAAVFGFAVAAVRAVRAAFGLLRSATEAYYAKETAGTRARRGDVTGMAEAERRSRSARRTRNRRLATFAAWTVAVALPAVTPWPRALYASYVAVWVVVRGLETRMGR